MIYLASVCLALLLGVLCYQKRRKAVSDELFRRHFERLNRASFVTSSDGLNAGRIDPKLEYARALNDSAAKFKVPRLSIPCRDRS
jgi:hypothetical protein